MESLLACYSSSPSSYYAIPCNAAELFTNSWDESENNCLGFLTRHYTTGEKTGLLSSNFLHRYKRTGKHVHSASLYLLGVKLLPIFKKPLDNTLTTFIPNFMSWGDDSRYVWYLPSMYHDFASCIEIGTIHPHDSELHCTLSFHLGNHNVQYSPYTLPSFIATNIPFRFSPDLISNYFYYRACHGSCEHGIIAGYLFFDRFVKNFMEHTGGHLDHLGRTVRYGLNWDIEHLIYAAYAADAIICHNIWLGGDSDKKTYKDYGLDPLLYKRYPENKVTVEKYPLQFMLCLLDTIEPIKRFSGTLSPQEILNGILLDYDESKKTLVLSWTADIARQPGFDHWHHSIVTMQDWMGLNVEEDSNRIAIFCR